MSKSIKTIFLATATAFALCLKLVIPPMGIYHGAFPGFGSTEDVVTCRAIRNFEKMAGKRLAWAYFSNNWTGGIKFPEKQIREIVNCGSVPFIRIMPRSNFEFGPEKVYTLQAIIEGKFDGQLRQWARRAKELGFPLLLDFAVEMNGDWFGWSGIYNGGSQTDGYGDPTVPDGPERYRDAYRHIIEIFRSEGVYNVTWFFHPNSESFPDEDWNRMENYYPGDEYIDWIGISLYGPIFPQEKKYWDQLNFAERLQKVLKEIQTFAPAKPIAILEFAVIEDERKPEWIRQAFEAIRSHPRIKAISWWNERWINEDGSISDLRINSSPEALQEYRLQAKRTLLLPFCLFLTLFR